MADPSKRRRLLLAALLLIALWLAAGLRPVDRSSYGVLDGPLGPTLRVDGSWALAPPGLLRSSSSNAMVASTAAAQIAEVVGGSTFSTRTANCNALGDSLTASSCQHEPDVRTPADVRF